MLKLHKSICDCLVLTTSIFWRKISDQEIDCITLSLIIPIGLFGMSEVKAGYLVRSQSRTLTPLRQQVSDLRGFQTPSGIGPSLFLWRLAIDMPFAHFPKGDLPASSRYSLTLFCTVSPPPNDSL